MGTVFFPNMRLLNPSNRVKVYNPPDQRFRSAKRVRSGKPTCYPKRGTLEQTVFHRGPVFNFHVSFLESRVVGGGKLLGPTDPATAPAGSLRNDIYKERRRHRG